MFKWLHHILDPHCLDCREEYLDSMVCDSCNTLRQENIALRKHNDHLIEALLDKVKDKVEQIPTELIVQQPVNLGKNQLSWHARRQMLETEDRAAAKVLRDKKKEMEPVSASISELEQELGVENNG
jgi:hypothetical protein